MLAKLSKRQHLACYIYEANIISALEMRYQQNKMTKEQVLQVKDLLMFSSEAKQYLEKMLNEEHSYAAVP